MSRTTTSELFGDGGRLIGPRWIRQLFPRPAPPPPKVSVVIPTYRRPDLLLRCLNALLAQDLPACDYEIIVVDDGSDAATRSVVEAVAWSATNAPVVSYLAAMRRAGPGAARNFGSYQARAALIAFTDDDTVPATDWLRQGLAALTDDRMAICGSVLMPLPDIPSDYQRDASGLTRAEFVCANCFVRRDALLAIGGFDERFTAAWREDSDLQFRLLARFGSQLKIGREPKAVVVHPVRPAGWGVSLRQQKKIQFDALLYKKHPQLYRSRIRRAPRYDYYLTVLLLLTAPLAAAAGWPWLASLAALAWAGLSLRFCLQRLRGTLHTPSHVAEMLVTSALLPPLAVYWRLVGALRYRVLFV